MQWQHAVSQASPAKKRAANDLFAALSAHNRSSSRPSGHAAGVLFAIVFVAGLLAVRPAAAINGSFTNDGSGWSGWGKLTNGSPHVTTNSSGTTVARIGTDGGTPGVAGGTIRSTTVDQCVGKADGRCGVKFHADFFQTGTEKAKVKVNYKNKSGAGSTPVANGTIGPGSHDWVINLADECGDTLNVSFFIESGGNPVGSTLDISAVSVTCDGTEPTILAMALPQFGDPPGPSYPLPLGGVPAGLPPQDADMIVQCPVGLSPVANPFSSGSNLLDQVFPAQDQTIFYKYDPQIGSFDPYYRNSGQWSPADGTFGPGDAGFIYSLVQQQFDFKGQYLPMPFGQHPSSGSAFFANPVDWPMSLADVMGFPPVVGDMLVIFQHGDTNNTAPPGTPDSMFVFQADNFALQPVIPPGETVQVFFADPGKVPMEIVSLSLASAAPLTNVLVTAPGGLPSAGLLQTADSLGTGAQWKSLVGVADYYWEPATNSARWFRLAFNVPTANFYGFLMQSNGAPASGLSVQLAPNGASQAADNNGQFSFFDVPIGLLDLEISAPVQVFDPTTSQFSSYTVSLPWPIDITSPVTTVAIKEDFTAVVFEPPQPPACPCKPWCGIVGGTVDGVQTVVAGGGSLPDPCPNGVCTVTITGPGGAKMRQFLGGGHAKFSPAANGVWTVTSTVCGITKTCSITLP